MSIRKNLRTALVSLIPGMVLGRIDKLQKDMDHSNSQKRMRAAIRMVILSLCFLFGSILGGFMAPIIFVPHFGTAGPILGSLAVGLVFAEWGAILGKQAVRLFSWLQHTHNTTVLNPTYPAKYTVNYGKDEQTSPEAEDAMRKLYEAKQEIKKNPNGYFGDLSPEQSEKCRAINYAAKQLRHTGSIHRIFWPGSNKIDRNDPNFRAQYTTLGDDAAASEISLMMRISDGMFFYKNHIQKKHLDFLSQKIIAPNTDDARRICSEGFNFFTLDSENPS